MNVENMRLVVIVCATLVTSAAVSISGVIGWVGLVVPHISRMIVGPNYSRLLPMSMVIGASFMLLVDDLSRTIAATEIPLGILTSLVGAPLFAYLITKGRTGWN
jgi:iron complex transport system permease protein